MPIASRHLHAWFRARYPKQVLVVPFISIHWCHKLKCTFVPVPLGTFLRFVILGSFDNFPDFTAIFNKKVNVLFTRMFKGAERLGRSGSQKKCFQKGNCHGICTALLWWHKLPYNSGVVLVSNYFMLTSSCTWSWYLQNCWKKSMWHKNSVASQFLLF